ncbi:PREDICTED: uncharacterized protein LOC109335452 [Lupinus angustifolius]|uniref:uncharacterized protein LOC109335452 n=1 Tax=Lupinus angustifolius TaxID=3871 RepID=UPI00092E433E|nr:PREDICTED: uncharacterized protein LOC109335452 [Lupinus angustifolius]
MFVHQKIPDFATLVNKCRLYEESVRARNATLRSVVSPPTLVSPQRSGGQGFGRGRPFNRNQSSAASSSGRHYKTSCPKLKREVVNSVQAARPRAQGRVVTLSGAEIGANEDLIQGTCNVKEILLSVLFDSGATNSFVAIDVVNRLALPIVSLPYDLLVTTPTSEPVIVSTVCSQCSITLENRVFFGGPDMSTLIPVRYHFRDELVI